VAAIDPWWQAFNDPVLSDLIEQALNRNNDLATAALTLRKARLQAGLSERELWPSLAVDGAASADKSLRGEQKISRRYSLEGSVSYEVDLWGKLSRQADADRWEAEATAEDLQSTALSLSATTATLYWQVLYCRERLALARETIAYTRSTQDLVQAQYDSGAASPLELYEAEQSVESQEAEATQIEQSLIEAENALAILFDGPPGQQMVTQTTLPDQPLPTIQSGVPADILACARRWPRSMQRGPATCPAFRSPAAWEAPALP
jgi:outer membrane protein TolC